LLRQDRDQLMLILGGARSGKSACAEKLALEHGGSVTYVATAQALDDEMAARIAQHKLDRPGKWQTREIPTGVGAALSADPPQTDVILLDCLTLLVTNLLMQTADNEGEADEKAAAGLVEAEIDSLLNAIRAIPASWIVVSNEVGLGLVPPYPLGRIYRDLLGRVNQRLAAQAEQVIFMIAGIPMRLAPN
jgi:adenosylcobinamide kinase/adenosylcobinamide-phosphate guanylyltransferase